jgi:signal transduction histidine kinase/integral membrane sensor domain MASE1
MGDIGASDQQSLVTGDIPAARQRDHAFTAAHSGPDSMLAVVVAPLACGLAYFLAAHLGRRLAFPFAPVSALWAPNAILLAALLLVPYRHWWIYLLALLPFHLLAQVPVFPLPLVAVHYAFNCTEALLGAYLILRLAKEPRRFDRLQTITVLITFAAFLAPLLTSLLTGAFIAQGMTERFWAIVIVRTATNAFAILTLVPLIVLSERWMRSAGKQLPSMIRVLEGVTCGCAIAVVGFLIYVRPVAGTEPSPALLYAPLPLLIWGTVRFGIVGTCVSELLLSLLSTWGILKGHGPFAAQLPLQNALSFVFFQLVTCIPLLFLAALVEERRHTARALATGEAKFRIVFENNIIPTLIWRDDFHISEVNEAFLRLTGFTRSDVVLGRVQCDELVRSYRDWEHRQPRTGHPVHEFDSTPMELKLSNGRRAPIVVGGGRFGQGHSGGVIYALDLSEFRSAEAGRRRAEGLHSAVLASLHDQVAVLDRDGFVLETNASWQRFSESIAAPSFHRLLPGENFLRACGAADANGDRIASAQLEAVASVLGKRAVRQNLEFSLPCADGQAWFELSVEVLNRPEGGAVVTRTDISARKQAETDARSHRQQLAHLGRAAVLGQLSGALAHELNQPLTSIRGNAEAGLQLLANDEYDMAEIREIFQDIVQDDERAVQVIQRLRGLLRKGEIQAQAFDLNAIVRQILDITRSDIVSRNVTVDTVLDLRGAMVLADRVQIQQVLLNLVINACEAMEGIPPRERKLRIATGTGANDGKVQLTVQDVGCGIAAGDLERIFEPFVTSKQEGLGLGLAICRSIVHAHDGHLWADNAADGGAILYLSLPVAPPAHVTVIAEQPRPASRPSGSSIPPG